MELPASLYLLRRRPGQYDANQNDYSRSRFYDYLILVLTHNQVVVCLVTPMNHCLRRLIVEMTRIDAVRVGMSIDVPDIIVCTSFPAIDCEYSEWQEWGACDTNCGDGVRVQPILPPPPSQHVLIYLEFHTNQNC